MTIFFFFQQSLFFYEKIFSDLAHSEISGVQFDVDNIYTSA